MTISISRLFGVKTHHVISFTSLLFPNDLKNMVGMVCSEHFLDGNLPTYLQESPTSPMFEAGSV
jgi:hypothetical protein